MLDKLNGINLQRMQGLQKRLKYLSMWSRRSDVTFFPDRIDIAHRLAIIDANVASVIGILIALSLKNTEIPLPAWSNGRSASEATKETCSRSDFR